MCFEEKVLPRIREALAKKQTIEFNVPRSISGFNDQEPPDEWTVYPPILSPDGYAMLLAQPCSSPRDLLNKAKLRVWMSEGQVLYMKVNTETVVVKFLWPGENDD